MLMNSILPTFKPSPAIIFYHKPISAIKHCVIKRGALIKKPKLFQVSAKIGRSEVVRLVLAATTAFIFLPLPDTDFIFLPILHHRSIITHSLLFGFVFLFLGKNTGAAPLAGAMLGLSVHLACDLLSPAIGFGQIWLPYPIKIGLGIFSYIWLAINCAIGFAIVIQWS